MPTVKIRAQLRKDTSALWAAANPVLLSGEPGFETDTKKLRIGDGVTAFISLPYVKLSTTEYQVLNSILTAMGGLAAAADKLGYFIGPGSMGLTDLTPFARTILDDANAAAARVTLALGDAALFNVTTSGETIAANDNDTDVPTNAAVIDLVDAKIDSALAMTLVETIPTISGATVETGVGILKPNKDYIFQYVGVLNNNAGNQNLQIAFYGETAAAYSPVAIIGVVSNGQRAYGQTFYRKPRQSRNLHDLQSFVYGSSGTAPTSDSIYGADTVPCASGRNYATAQGVSRVRWSLGGGQVFVAGGGSILVWELS